MSTLWDMIGRVLPWVTGGDRTTSLGQGPAQRGVQIDDRVKLRPGAVVRPPIRRPKPARQLRPAASGSKPGAGSTIQNHQPSLFDTPLPDVFTATDAAVQDDRQPPAAGAIVIRPAAAIVPAQFTPVQVAPVQFSGADFAAAVHRPPGLHAPRRLPIRGEEAEARYEEVVRVMLARYNVRVRRWRKNMSGVAWILEYRDGTTKRWLESPKPKTPLSLSIFLHEIGHHAIGFRVYKPRCLEEYHAWAFAISAMHEQGIQVTESVRRRMHKSLKYAVDKAVRRGLKDLPAELEPFTREYVAQAADDSP